MVLPNHLPVLKPGIRGFASASLTVCRQANLKKGCCAADTSVTKNMSYMRALLVSGSFSLQVALQGADLGQGAINVQGGAVVGHERGAA